MKLVERSVARVTTRIVFLTPGAARLVKAAEFRALAGEFIVQTSQAGSLQQLAVDKGWNQAFEGIA
ncbi:MAG: hypothetical protein QM790_00645 [Nibricoccus sp.]